MTATVNINFSRYESIDVGISASDMIYLFVNRYKARKLKSGFINGNLILGG